MMMIKSIPIIFAICILAACDKTDDNAALSQTDVVKARATLERNMGNSDENMLQAGLPYRLPIVPDGKIIRNDRGGKYIVVETSFSPAVAGSFYEQAGKKAGFKTMRADGSGGVTVSGEDGDRKWRIMASENGAKNKISFHQTGK